MGRVQGTHPIPDTKPRRVGDDNPTQKRLKSVVEEEDEEEEMEKEEEKELADDSMLDEQNVQSVL